MSLEKPSKSISRPIKENVAVGVASENEADIPVQYNQPTVRHTRVKKTSQLHLIKNPQKKTSQRKKTKQGRMVPNKENKSGRCSRKPFIHCILLSLA